MEEARPAGSGGSPPNSDSAAISSEELDHVPLVRRRIMMLAEKQRSNPPMLGSIVKDREDEGCTSLDIPSLMPARSSREAGIGVSRLTQNHEHGSPSEISPKVLCHKVVERSALDGCLQNRTCGQSAGTLRDCLSDYSMKMSCIESNGDVAQVVKLDGKLFTSHHSSMISEFSPKARVKYSDNNLHSVGGDINGSSTADVQTVVVKSEICDDVADDHLDHIVLKERQRMLLSRRHLGLENPVLEGVLEGKDEIHVTRESLPVKSQFDGIHEMHTEILQTSDSFNLPDDNDRICSLARKYMESNSYEGKDVPVYTYGTNVPSLSNSVKIKDEPQDGNCHVAGNARGTFFFDISTLKTKSEISDELDEDEADDMCLGDRMKLLRPGGADNEPSSSRNCKFVKKSAHRLSEGSHMTSEPARAFSINRPRKRKKTATDSVETALEEDAPGLLQVLVEKGVLIGEIKLYGETENDEALDDSSSDDTFSELESVMSKIFSQGTSFFKFAPIRYTKGARASYCLACLIALVEQSRYLQFRKWPVEWGWCRDLQSFIFVFERHKRIVLERPEYGYATYFFELDSLPIDWQIKRLVTVMKLTTFSRISLIENKALSVGEDLTEGEAKVLIGYGWSPNSGLGTMLKYCDRVVHDRRNERDTSEWRSKIGKLLMEGYNGGTVVATDVLEKVVERGDSQGAQMKLEI